MDTKHHHYHAEVAWSEDDACYVARVPAFDHCMAHGDTPEEAIREVYDGLAGVINAMQERGMELPKSDEIARRLKELKSFIKISRLAETVGIPSSTLSSKIDRGGPFSADEIKRLRDSLQVSI